VHLLVERPGYLLDHVDDREAILRRTGISHIGLLSKMSYP
jgi:hypothetical protein